MPLKYLSNLWRTLKISQNSLDLRRSKNCVLTSKATRQANPDTNPAIIGINNPTNGIFEITDCKLYFPVVTVSAKNENKLLE